MQFIASQPLGITQIWGASVKLSTASFTKWLGFILISAVSSISIGLLNDQLLSDMPTSPENAPVFSLSSLMLEGGSIILFLLSLVCEIAIIYRIDNVANGREDSFKAALIIGFKKLPSLLLASILYVIAVAVGCFLLVIPGIIFLFSMGLFIYFIVIDSLGGYASLKASDKLVWGYWWRNMAVVIVPVIVILAVTIAMTILVALLGINNKSLISVVMNLVSACFLPYFLTLGYVQFHDLKLRKSGSNVELRLTK